MTPTRTSPQRKQASIEVFIKPRALASATAGQGSKGKGNKGPAGPPAPPEAKDVLGCPVLKDFVADEEPHEVRPFKGLVTSINSNGYFVVYEDGDNEHLKWKALWPLMQRAKAAGLQKLQTANKSVAGDKDAPRFQQGAPAPVASQQGGPPAKQRGRPPKQQQQEQEQQQPAVDQQGAPPAKARSRPPKQQQAAAAATAEATAVEASAAAAKKAGKAAKTAEQGARTAPQLASNGATAAAGQKRKKAAASTAATAAAAAGEGGSCDTASGSKPGKKRKAVGGAAVAGGSSEAGGSKPATKPRQVAGPAIDLPLPQLGEKHVYTYPQGEEPWRSQAGFSWPIHDELDLSAEAINRVKAVQRLYNKEYIKAEVDEKERTDSEVADQKARGVHGTVKRPSKRPDRVAESRLKKSGQTLGGAKVKVAGHYPGWNIGSRAYSRSELTCIGFHLPPVAGIDYVAKGSAGTDSPAFATSVMVSGWYQDDKDSGAEMWYTGEGGNDLLHGRNQVSDQVLKRGNLALVGNIQLGIPVRVTRKQTDKHGHFGVAYIFDGLYDVVSYRHVKGKEGTKIYQFLLRRRPGQGALLSERVVWGGISAAREVVPKTRQGVVDLDITGGQEGIPIPAIDDTWLAQEHCDSQPHGDIPCCTALENVVDETQLMSNVLRGVNQKRLDDLRASSYTPSVQYISQYEYVGRAASAVELMQKAVLPEEHKDNPHAYLAQLNHGKVAYNERGQLYSAKPVVYECGPWAGCTLGTKCPQAVSQRSSKFRLEIFKTTNGCGWGVRSLDTIPQHAFICLYIAEVYLASEHEELVSTVEEQDAAYTFDLISRPDSNWDGSEKPEAERSSARAEYVACGLRKRNVAAWINHSCASNCFVQPLLSHHHDTRMPFIAIFASDNIAPMTELTLDYGEAYMSGFAGGCKCGAADCCSTRGEARRSPGGPAQAVVEEAEEVEAAAGSDEEEEGSEEEV